MSKLKVFVLYLSIALLCGSAFAFQGEQPRSFSLTEDAAADVGSLELEAIDAEALRERSVERHLSARTEPLRIAEPADLEVTPTNAGTWATLSEGHLWRLRIDAPGSTDLNFGFGTFDLPVGATLHVVSLVQDGYYLGPYTHRHPTDGQLWTPVVPGGAAMIELFVPFGAAKPDLVLSRVGRGFMDFFHQSPEVFLRQGSCNIDVVCPEGDGWRDQIRSVGAYTLNGADQCTGTLVNNTSGDFTPYFVTAAHCNIGSGNAASVVVYWNYESANCGDLSGGLRNQSTSGTIFRAEDGPNDMSLLELSSVPDAAYNVYYSGWDARAGVVPSGTVGIHHPGVDEKAISFDTDPPITVSNCIGTGGGQSNTHWEVVWNQGTTERGSSGSALFSSDTQRLIGYLSGGSASCSNQNGDDCYGKMSVGYGRGMQAFLDPANTGALFVDGADPAGGNDAPVVTISAPAGGSTFDLGTSVTFSGSANDTEDGNLSANLAWSSSIDGALGTGASVATAGLSAGNHTVTASVTDSGGATGTATVSITIDDPNSNGPQTAVYDGALGAPKCAVAGTSCDSTTLLVGRATKGPEPNQPNTLDACTDGNSGTFHDDESNDRIVVSTLDGGDFAAGKTVRIDATVWAFSSFGSDSLDLYYAADADNPSWTFIATLNPTAAGEQVLSTTYTLPSGSLQAVRANFRYQGSASSCGTGNWDDTDDLVFAVGGASPNTAPSASISAPANGASFEQGASVTFTGSAGDAEDGDLSASLSWSSSIDGALGTGASVATSALSVGSHTITASVTDSGGLSASTTVAVTVTQPTVTDQTATFDGALQAPKCGTVGKSCDSAALLDGRGTKGPEPNQPNTIADACGDGTSGTYHVDESIDALKVSTNDGGAFAAGKTVTVEATVWAWSTGSEDSLDLYYAADANSPSWTFIATLSPSAGGAQTLSTTYTLPAGSLQAIRGNFRYQGSASSCSGGNYDDADDLIFAVAP
ncbi:MAG: PKD domain-containing protein [Acidobacteriota bacterium]